MKHLKNILVVAAHPDDEVLGAGGTMARYSKEGRNVSVLILGEGVTSRDPKRRAAANKKKIQSLKAQAKNANKLLGVKDIFFNDLPDNRFDTVALLEVVKIIEKHIAKIKPDAVFTHSNSDLNIDHVITHRAVLTATRPTTSSVREVYAFEVPSSTDWAFGEFGSFKPNVFFDVKAVIMEKIKAMQLYKSEDRESPHPRSTENIKAQARRHGSAVGLEYAEAFELIRSIR